MWLDYVSTIHEFLVERKKKRGKLREIWDDRLTVVRITRCGRHHEKCDSVVSFFFPRSFVHLKWNYA